MTTTNPAKPYRPTRGRLFGPRPAFIAAIVCAFATWNLAGAAIPQQLVVPAVSTLLLLLAAAFAAFAWNAQKSDLADVTYWDVAGALTLIGICTSALIEPDQLARFFEGAPAKK
jgi:hypothetical protein